VGNFNKQSSPMCGYINHSVSNVKDFFSSKALRLFLCLLLIIFPVTIIAQIFQATFLKIDSLKKVLPALKDSARIDCLNALTNEYILIQKKDSAEYYRSLAFEKAKSLNYAHGLAESYSCKAGIELKFNNDFREVEKLGQESLKWYKKTGNKKNIELAYFQIGFAFFGQGLFDNALQSFKECNSWCLENKNTENVFIPASHITAAIYKEKGDYNNFFDHIKKGYHLALKTNNKALLSATLFQTGEMYMKLDDYEAALEYFRQAFQMDNPELRHIRQGWDIWVKHEYAEIFSHLKQFDSAWHYYNLFKPYKSNEVAYRVYLISTAECHFLQGHYKQALENFLIGLDINKKLNDKNQIMRALLGIAKIHSAQHNDTASLRYARETLGIAKLINAKQVIRDVSGILYAKFDQLNQKDSSSIYFKEFITTKEIIATDQTKGKLVAYNYEQRIELLDTENQIQQQKLNQAAQQKKIFIAGLTALCLISIVIFRNLVLKRRNEKLQLEHELEIQKLESEKTRAELQQQATELEMQGLRAQMNPHFIFNSLTSINRFILQNNKAQASEYLTKFSRLVRLILQNSQSALIPLESELESLQLYLELEAVRFDHHFEFKIKVDNELETDIIKVPPLIIQPYAENAIWHGLMHKEEKGNLEIAIFQQGDFLCCKITDDGIGRNKAVEIKSKSASTHKSMGMQITASRIQMLQQKKQLDTNIKITDLVLADGSAGGTEVLLKIPFSYD
jgi:tetratricopeptide (TPR) repeat protein